MNYDKAVVPIKEFVGLKPSLYSFLVESKRCK